jgi:hypothetical protein
MRLETPAKLSLRPSTHAEIFSSETDECVADRPKFPTFFTVDGKPSKRREWLAGELGFEPRFSESESDVLPLNYSPKIGRARR